MVIQVLPDADSSSSLRALEWDLGWDDGDVFVGVGATWLNNITLTTPSGPGLTFTQRVAYNPATFGDLVYIWTAVASGSSSPATFTSTVSASCVHSGAMWKFPAADGFSLAASPNTITGEVNGSSVSANLAGTAGNYGVVILGGLNGTNWSGRSWNLSADEAHYTFSNTNNTQASAHCVLTGSSNAVGISGIPSGESTRIAAIEVLWTDPGPGVVDQLMLEQGGFILMESGVPLTTE